MNTIKKFWDDYQAKRIDHILNWPSSRVLTNRWVKRTLAVLAVVSSWSFLFLLTPGLFPALSSPVPYQLLSGLVMLSSFMLLRQSVRRITSLPDEYLDEREIENRDWAYRLGYLVVRRIGLFLTVGLFAFELLTAIGGHSITIETITEYPESPAKDLYLQASDFIRSYFALSPVIDLLMILLLLTFVAYSFPVILLAWRESNMQQFAQPATDWHDALRRYSKGYFTRLTRTLWVFLLTLGAVIGHLQDFWLNLAAFTLAYLTYVYFWAMVIMFEIIGKLKPFAEVGSAVAKQRKTLQVLTYVSIGIGITVPISSWYTGLYASDPYSFFAVLGLLVLQVVSFSVARKMAEEAN